MNNFSQEDYSRLQKDENPDESSLPTEANQPAVHPSDQDNDTKRTEAQTTSPRDLTHSSAEDVERHIYPMTSPINTAPAK